MAEPKAPAGHALAFACITSLFFAWGFVTALIDPLIAAVRHVFDLSLAQAMLTASAWFIAYGVVSLPAGWVLSRLGYSRTVILALGIMVLGSVIVPAATYLDTYGGVLLALFVIASGVTLLQVTANPLSTALGPAKTSHFRLAFSQAFNSLGTTLGPVIGSSLLLTGGIFAADALVTPETRGESLRSIDLAFLAVGLVFAVIAVFIFAMRRRIDGAVAEAPAPVSPFAAFHSAWAVSGALALFLYVGAEVTIGSLLIPFLSSVSILGIEAQQAGHMAGWFYWGAAMVGRFAGSLLLTRINAGALLSACAMVAMLLALLVSQSSGPVAAWAALGIGLFNSVMFPTIFSLTLERSSAPAAATSGLLVFGITGGAILPPLAGWVADRAGSLSPAFLVPALAYGVLIAFAMAHVRSQPAVAAALPAS